MSFSHPESAASLLVAYYSNGLAQGTAEGGGIPQPAVAGSRCPSRLPSDLAFVPHPRRVPGVLPGSATGQQSCSRSEGTGVVPCRGEQLGTRVLRLRAHKALSSSAFTLPIENLSSEDKRLVQPA